MTGRRDQEHVSRKQLIAQASNIVCGGDPHTAPIGTTFRVRDSLSPVGSLWLLTSEDE
jgi:hypothetical protein